MKKFITALLLLTSVFVFAENLVLNPDFTAVNGVAKHWNLRKTVCSVNDKAVQITLKKGQNFHLFNAVVTLDQKERAPIYFGCDYRGFCNTKTWEHCVVLADLIYQDGSKESWGKVLIEVPSKADDWTKLEKTVNLPKPVKSFRFMVLLKDETKAEIRNPVIKEIKKKELNNQIVIVLPSAPLETELFAAKELADHIKAMTNKTVSVISEDKQLNKTDIAVYLGRTQKAVQNGFEFSRFSPEKWQISSVDNGLIIGGGNFNGTLYGVYNYLENICGVKWFNLTEKKIPQLKELPVRDLNLSGQPAFKYRALIADAHDYDGNFLMRNRQNANFSGWKFSIFDGITYIGPNIHTHCIWVKPSKYFKNNPEFFALMKSGKRTKANLCMMNKDCRKAMISEVREALRKHYAGKDKKQSSHMQIVNISHMDNMKAYCVCKECTEFAAKHKAISACDIDFINEVATALKEEFPNIIFQTLAYTYTEKPPVGITVADNVCVQMCDTTSNIAVPVSHPDNTFFLDSLIGWTKISKNVMVWDYWISYNFGVTQLANELPCATVSNIAADLRLFRKLGIPMILSEMEYHEGTSDVFDFKKYLALKLMENPYLDEKKLAADFANDFYGAAGSLFLEYRSKLAEVQKKWHPFIPWDASYGRFTYLDTAFLKEMQDLFDRGEKILASDPVRLKRWQQARISLDRAVGLRISYLIEEFMRTGQPVEKFPFDVEKCAERVKNALTASTRSRYNVSNIRLPQKNALAVVKNVTKASDKNIDIIYKRMTMTKPAVISSEQLPKELASFDRSKLHIFPLASAFMFLENSGIRFKLEAEKDSFFGSVAVREFDSEKQKNIGEIALQSFTYKTDTRTNYSSIKSTSAIPDQPGWHWVKIGNIKSSSNTYLTISGTWECQLDISCLAGPEHKVTEHELWYHVRIKKDNPEKVRLEYDCIILKDIK